MSAPPVSPLRRAFVELAYLGWWRGRRSGAPSSATAARPRTARRHVLASRLAVPTGATQADDWCGHSRTRTPSRSFRMSPSATSSTKSCPPRRRNAPSSRDGDVRPRRRHGPHGMTIHMYSCASSDARTSGRPTVECSPFNCVDSRRGRSPRVAAVRGLSVSPPLCPPRSDVEMGAALLHVARRCQIRR